MDNHFGEVDYSDPAAEFLANEQNKLAQLDLDGDVAFNNFDQPQNGFDEMGGAFESDDHPVQNGFDSVYSAIADADRSAKEPEKIKIWREEQRLRLAKNDAEEQSAIKEWVAVASKELADWYANLDQKLAKTRADNRANEDETLRDREVPSDGLQWDRICKLVDFNAKTAKGTKDVSRMRSIFLQLKAAKIGAS